VTRRRHSPTSRWRTRERLAAEPPVVVDASVAVQWFAPEPGSAEAARLLRTTALFLAPDFMPLEASNAWWKKCRRREMSSEQVEQAIRRLLAVGLDLIPNAPLLTPAVRLALELGQPVYDCVYLALAGQHAARLATADAGLRKSAQRLGLPLWRP
jgi:predicted nucleic acid-binding protein